MTLQKAVLEITLMEFAAKERRPGRRRPFLFRGHDRTRVAAVGAPSRMWSRVSRGIIHPAGSGAPAGERPLVCGIELVRNIAFGMQRRRICG